MGYVFISYSHKDRQFVRELVQGLQQAGVSVWYDVQQLPAGASWSNEIEKAIYDADACLVVIGSNFSQSYSSHIEATIAATEAVPVIPIYIEEVPFSEIPVNLASYQGIYFNRGFARSLDTLVNLLPPSVRQEKPQRKKKTKSKGYVFISYAEEDSVFVEQLCGYLKEKGYGFWDYRSSDRDYQTLLFLELEAAISKAAATLSILSPDWKKSPWTPKEMLFSQEVSVPVFLLMSRPMGPTLVTAGMTYIDFTKNDNVGFAKLDKELKRKGLI